MPDPYIPVTLVAADIDAPVGRLIAQLGDAVVLDSIGMRVITRECAAEVIASHHAARQAERERQEQRRAQVAANNTALRTRERVRRLAAKQAAQGLVDPDVPALAAMLSGTDDDRLERSGGHMSEMLSNATSMTYHKIKESD